ncbi:MAG TPA: hypothetical protein VN673_03440, partial [Clostridia bacterium]|nr:hypothetical protein [Clostridia bacterium]
MCSKKTAVALCLLLMVALSAAWFIGRPTYRRHKETRAVQQAKEFIAKGDYRSASLSARQALLANPHNLDACRMMAELAEMAQSTNALEWLRRIAETAPTTENKLRLAAAALRFQPPPFPLTSNLLHEISATASNLPTFHLLSAERALKLNHVTDALAHFQCASRLEPSNELHRLNLAVLNLTSTNPAIATAARANLERLRSHTNLSAVALRWLIAECLRQGDRQTAQTHSEQLVADPRALFDDHLQHLAILHGLNSPNLQTRLQLTQARAGTNAVELYKLSAWMISRSKADAALHWIKSCPSQT